VTVASRRGARGTATSYQAIEAAYRHLSTSHDFDATVVARNASGKVEIVRRHDEPVRHGASSGFGWGLAVGAVAALFPAVGILEELAADVRAAEAKG
jgi:uncharacterized membrane protein